MLRQMTTRKGRKRNKIVPLDEMGETAEEKAARLEQEAIENARPLGDWIRVRVVRAENLPRADFSVMSRRGGKSDPYCVLVLSESDTGLSFEDSKMASSARQTATTAVVNDSTDPTWDEEFWFHIADKEQPLSIPTLLVRVM